MDAVKFLQERQRMYESGAVTPGYDYDPASAVKVVEEWAAAHPVKTRQSVFLEQYPEARIADGGVLGICPVTVSAKHRNEVGGCVNPSRQCNDCRREYWMQEVE